MIDLVSNSQWVKATKTWHHYAIMRKFWVWQSSGSSKQAKLNYGHAWAAVPTLMIFLREFMFKRPDLELG